MAKRILKDDETLKKFQAALKIAVDDLEKKGYTMTIAYVVRKGLQLDEHNCIDYMHGYLGTRCNSFDMQELQHLVNADSYERSRENGG